MVRALLVLASLLLLALVAPAQARGVTLWGRVVDPLGEGVPAAQLVVRSQLGEVVRRGATDGEGMFALARLPIERLEIEASADGRAARPQVVWSTLRRNEPFTLRMFDAAPIEGRVVDVHGAPVEGAEILVARRDRSALADWEATATTDAGGAFRIGAPLGPLRVRVAAAEHGVLRESLDWAGSSPVEWALPEGRPRTLQVRLRAAAGIGVADRLVSVHAQRADGGGSTLLVRGRTDADGVFECRVGTDEALFVGFSDGDTFGARPQAAEVAPSPEAIELDFVAEARHTVPIRGVLLDPQGAPLVDEWVLAKSPGGRREHRGVTDGEGRFEIEVPFEPDLEVQLELVSSASVLDLPRCRVEGGGAVEEPAVLWRGSSVGGGSRVVLRAVPGAHLAGVVRLEDGSPAAHCDVQVFEGELHARRALATVRTGPRGEFDLFGVLPAGGSKASIRVFGGRAFQARAAVAFGPGEHVHGLRIPAREVSAIEGLVRDASGTPLAGWPVSCVRKSMVLDDWSAHESRSPGLVTDRDGRFRVWIAPGRASLHVPGTTGSQVVQVWLDEVAKVEIAVDK